MNILFLGLLYHPDDIDAVLRQSRDGLQNQINSYQWSFIDGLRKNLGPRESLHVLNALPVGAFPRHYRRWRLPAQVKPDGFQEIGSLNLPWFKQRARARRAAEAMERWIAADPENRTVLLYTLYLPYLQAILAVKKRHPDLKISVIVTDLPNEMGIRSGRTGLLRRIEFARGRKSLRLAAQLDGYVLLTEPMADAMAVRRRPFLVMEGLIAEAETMAGSFDLPDDPRPAVLYAGTLNRELGITALLDAFQTMKDVQLWLCGRGDGEAEVRKSAETHGNIRYFGFVPQPVALTLQAHAAALINPRPSAGLFTRYSFPSKTLEYMRSGKPVLCCRLEGIPREYDAYLRYIEPEDAAGIRDAVRALLSLPAAERERLGAQAREFVRTQKNSVAQGAKLYAFLRAVQENQPTDIND
ncbi:MAG: glycosyltransferase family 4 protein [Clostridiales bacterium]|nr:glycosyltransferase family 4 protein [Clostridiales bacterium]